MAWQQLTGQDNQALRHVTSLAHAQTPAVTTPTSKRRKIEIACETCRLRKSRCDGVRPKCGACMRRRNVGPVCNYIEASRREQPISEPTNTNADSPVVTYPREAVVTQRPLRNGRARSLHSSVDDCSPRSIPDLLTRYESTSRFQNQRSPNSDGHHHNHPPEIAGSEDEHDDSGHSDSWIVKAGLLGASSSASFIRSICRAVGGDELPAAGRPNASMSSKQTANKVPPDGRYLRAINNHTTDYVLPPRKRADRLLEMHWEHSHIPWIDRLRLTHWYERLWSGHEDENRDINEQIYYCILNVVFALSYIDINGPEPDAAESRHLSQVHFSRAQRLFSFNLLDISYIGLVQALLVMVQYFQSTNMTRQCFQCTGLAILVAQNLGLHLPHTTSRIRSQHDREMARRAWHGCILVDRITSMIYSQPMRISQEIARQSHLPAAIDDEYLEDGDAEGTQPLDRPSRLNFFRLFCKLHIILGDVLSTFYAGSSTADQEDSVEHMGTGAKPDVDRVIYLDKKLDEWLTMVDSHLQINDDFQPTNPEFKGQALNLYARYLNIRLLLYRTFLSEKTSALLDSQPVRRSKIHDIPQFADTISFQGLVTCVRIAQQLLRLISLNIDEDNPSKQVPPWWHTVSYVYSAATVMIAAHLFPAVIEQISEEKLDASIQEGFGILAHYITNEKPAQRCKAALTVLYEKMRLATTMPKQTPNGTAIPPASAALEGSEYDANLTSDLSTDFAWADIIGSSDLFSRENDLTWLYTAPFDQQNNSLWPP